MSGRPRHTRVQLSKFDLLAARQRVTEDIHSKFISLRSIANPARWKTAGLICLSAAARVCVCVCGALY